MPTLETSYESILDSLLYNWKAWQSVRLVLLLLIAAIYLLKEMVFVLEKGFGRNLGDTHYASSLVQYSNLESEEGKSWKYNYYTYDLDSSLFLRWFLKEAFGHSSQLQ